MSGFRQLQRQSRPPATCTALMALALALMGCSGIPAVGPSEDVPEFEIHVSRKATGPCTPTEVHCAHVSISYPELASDPSPLTEAVNRYTREYVVQTLASFIPDAPTSAEPGLLMDSFLQSYLDFVSEFPGTSQKWFIEVQGEVLQSPEGFLTLRFDVHTYTGGAHFNDRRDYASFEVAGGRAIQVATIVSDTEKLEQLAEGQFRRVRSIPAGIRLDEAGFFSETNGQFELPLGNFGLVEQGLVFYYNPYEIAAYAQGPTEIVLPYAIIRPFLTIELSGATQVFRVKPAPPQGSSNR